MWVETPLILLLHLHFSMHNIYIHLYTCIYFKPVNLVNTMHEPVHEMFCNYHMRAQLTSGARDLDFG